MIVSSGIVLAAKKAMTDKLVTVNHVSKRFCRNLRRATRYGIRDMLDSCIPSRAAQPAALRPEEFWALQNVHFSLSKGEVVGVIGPNGSGKSTLLNIVSGVLKPTVGSVETHSPKIALLDYSLGLNPLMTGRENIHNRLSLMDSLGTFSPEDVEEIASFSGLESLVDVPVGTYSTGMRARLAFSIYTKINPDLFIVDEGLGSADIQFVTKIQEYWVNYVKKGGAMLFASHDISTIQLLCNRVIILNDGQIAFSGGVDEGIHWYYEHENVSDPVFGSGIESAAPGRNAQPIEEDAILGQPCESVPSDGVSLPIEVEDIELLSCDAQNPERVETTGTVQVNMHYASSDYFENVWWGLDFHDDHGRFVTNILSRGATSGPINLAPGKGVLSCTIKSFPLMPGRYRIRGGIIRDEAVIYLGWKGYRDEPVMLRVYGAPGNSLQSARARAAMLFMDVDWNPE